MTGILECVVRNDNYGIPYPEVKGRPILGYPVIELSVVTEVKGRPYYSELLVSHVIRSDAVDSCWFIYGIVNETLGGDPGNIQVLTLRWFQNRAYLCSFRLASAEILECRLMNIKAIENLVKEIPAIQGYRIVEERK